MQGTMETPAVTFARLRLMLRLMISVWPESSFLKQKGFSEE